MNRLHSVDFDVVVAGAGIVGLATAFAIQRCRPDLSIAVIEKEAGPARHQTGRNSGVIHSGLYYKPGSVKAVTCRRGREQLITFCEEFDVPIDLCGKVVVALDCSEQLRLKDLISRGHANGVSFTEIGPDELQEIEPHCAGISGLHVHDTGIVDYVAVCDRLATEIRNSGEIRFNAEVTRVRETTAGVEVITGEGSLRAKAFVNCGGLYCDRIMKAAGVQPLARIVPFRGDYYELTPDARSLCRNLIYPVPDPAFPFLGVHLTRMIDGTVECGPNAVLAFGREGYRLRDINWRDLLGTLNHRGFRKLAWNHLATGFAEMQRSVSRHAFANAVRRLVPELRDDQLIPAQSGVRAQAIGNDGKLVDDFLIHETERSVHVNNAPSPAATASLEIGNLIANQVLTKIK